MTAEYKQGKHDICLAWTHPDMEQITRPDDFSLSLTPFSCCGYAEIGDVQASDLTPTPPGMPPPVSKVRRAARRGAEGPRRAL